MPDDARAVRKNRKVPKIRSCPIEVRAHLFSIAGIALLVGCVALTSFLVAALSFAPITNTQLIILFVLTGASWIYFVNSTTERFHLSENVLEFRSSLGRSRQLPISDLELFSVTHFKLTTDRAFGAATFQLQGEELQEISLGPCWKRRELDMLTATLQDMMQ